MTVEHDVVGLPPHLADIYRALDWERAACRRSWVPTAAWMSEGWGHTPTFPLSSNEFDMMQAAIDAGLPVGEVSFLELAAMLHWREIGQEPGLVGRRSPMTTLARTLCKVCPIQRQCLDWALLAHEPGVWGGTTERQRRDIRSARRQRHHRS